MAELVPEYLDIDFTTLVSKIKEELADSDNPVFRDMNYEGSNISLLIELVAYLGELNTFYLNKIAKNAYIDTADVYENVNRLSRYLGYEPKGYRSAKVNLQVAVSNCPTTGIKVPQWKTIDSGEQTDDGDAIKFVVTKEYTSSSPTSAHTFDLLCRQGIYTELPIYEGRDLVDNELVLPSNYAYDDDIDDDYPTIEIAVKSDGVNFEPWTRVEDFYDDATVLSDNDDIYMFVYDKYERNKVVFHSSRNVPEEDHEIRVRVIQSLGTDGSVGADVSGWTPEDDFILNTTTSTYLDNSTITVSNSGASTGAAEPEEISIIKENARSALHAQFRNVTSDDYIAHLESRSDVIAANAWGEQDLAPSGSIDKYNKVYISVIPDVWGTNTISTSSGSISADWGNSGTTSVATAYSTSYANTLKTYMEPRKIISAYEEMVVPDLVYFTFHFGVRIKRLYQLSDVTTDILNKLIYYFRNANQEFNSKINFMDIHEYLVDTSEVSPTDSFSNIKGIRNLNIREIDLNKSVYALNTDGNYPYYTVAASTFTGENQLRPIQLGHDQFPVLSSDTVKFTQET